MRFVAGHEVQMKPRDKQELEVLSTTLLSLVDQLQPGMVVQLDAADILIRRILSLCLLDKLDDDYLDVLSNLSGSHLAPLECQKPTKSTRSSRRRRTHSQRQPRPLSQLPAGGITNNISHLRVPELREVAQATGADRIPNE